VWEFAGLAVFAAVPPRLLRGAHGGAASTAAG
jgi:hypothetical protein